jgi:ABC-2 type transport system permease protein
MTPFEILLGKIIPPLLIGFLQATTIFLLGILTLGLPVHGNVPLLFLSLLIFILAIEGVGIVISCLAKTQQQATLGVFMFMTPAIAISGFATPVASMPLWLQWVSIFNPLKYFLIIIRGICFKAMPPDEIWRNIVPMIFIAIGTLCLSILLFKRKTG